MAATESKRFPRAATARPTAVMRTIAGPPGPHFVLVHGIGVSSRYFGPTTTALTKYGTVHLVDLPGHGHAPKPKYNVSIEGHARALGALLRKKGIPDPVLIGHSMGCQV